MAMPLEFPDGVRLAREDEIPGPESERQWQLTRIQAASISPGYVMQTASDSRFAFYAEANVDAGAIWDVFHNLSHALIHQAATLILSDIDSAPESIGSTTIDSLLEILAPHQYQLAHDGLIQFGLVDDGSDGFTEVFVSPTKHFRVWFSDANGFRSVMRKHDVPEVTRLTFIDEFPRTTSPLPFEKVGFHSHQEMIAHLAKQFDHRTTGGA